jgi:hypothetical protein
MKIYGPSSELRPLKRRTNYLIPLDSDRWFSMQFVAMTQGNAVSDEKQKHGPVVDLKSDPISILITNYRGVQRTKQTKKQVPFDRLWKGIDFEFG